MNLELERRPDIYIIYFCEFSIGFPALSGSVKQIIDSQSYNESTRTIYLSYILSQIWHLELHIGFPHLSISDPAGI